MSKATKFVYVSLNSNDEFQRAKRENSNIVPCSLYVDKEEQKIYFVEEKQGEILDFIPDICINDSPGLSIGSGVIEF